MIPELGQIALLIAFAIALIQGTLPIIGAAKGNAQWMALARPAAFTQFLFVAAAIVCLALSFVNNDFSVLYVATNSNSALPLRYRIAAVWGGHEGSILLWVFILGFWMSAVARFSRNLPDAVVARILGVMGLVSFGFLLFMLTTSNPFERLIPAAPDGRDLNPLLQDPGMVFHPPMLYMGYVGFSVAFSFAVAALLGGNLDATWARWTRPWTTIAWCCLTVGICLGSAWAYYVLGWGGWWFWDPVENASFMPWLAGTALMHSLAVTEKRGSFKVWTVLLAILVFSLSLLGTFLVRSGVLSSVHAFASDPKRGLFILIFIGIVTGGSLALFAWRAPKVGLGGRFDTVSRETMLLMNNVFLIAACGVVMLGTLYPLALDALGLDKISVGPPYFNTVFAPVMAPLVFLMGVGPLARWKSARLPELAGQLKWALALAVVATALTGLVKGYTSFVSSCGFLLVYWLVSSTLYGVWERVRPAGGIKTSLTARLRILPRGYLGMVLAHLAVAVFIFGVTMVKTFEVERDVKMDIGDTVELGGYAIQFQGTENVTGPNYTAARARMRVTRDRGVVREMFPEKRIFRVQSNPMTETAIARHLTHDLYISLGEQLGANTWTVRVYYKPFVAWIWGGCVLMAAGGLLAISDRRYRTRAATATQGIEAGAVGAAA